jgi:hypothetical protein
VNADGISFRGQDQVPQFVKQGRPEGQRVQDAITVQGLKEFTIVIEGQKVIHHYRSKRLLQGFILLKVEGHNGQNKIVIN